MAQHFRFKYALLFPETWVKLRDPAGTDLGILPTVDFNATCSFLCKDSPLSIDPSMHGLIAIAYGVKPETAEATALVGAQSVPIERAESLAELQALLPQEMADSFLVRGDGVSLSNNLKVVEDTSYLLVPMLSGMVVSYDGATLFQTQAGTANTYRDIPIKFETLNASDRIATLDMYFKTFGDVAPLMIVGATVMHPVRSEVPSQGIQRHTYDLVDYWIGDAVYIGYVEYDATYGVSVRQFGMHALLSEVISEEKELVYNRASIQHMVRKSPDWSAAHKEDSTRRFRIHKGGTKLTEDEAISDNNLLSLGAAVLGPSAQRLDDTKKFALSYLNPMRNRSNPRPVYFTPPNTYKYRFVSSLIGDVRVGVSDLVISDQSPDSTAELLEVGDGISLRCTNGEVSYGVSMEGIQGIAMSVSPGVDGEIGLQCSISGTVYRMVREEDLVRVSDQTNTVVMTSDLPEKTVSISYADSNVLFKQGRDVILSIPASREDVSSFEVYAISREDQTTAFILRSLTVSKPLLVSDENIVFVTEEMFNETPPEKLQVLPVTADFHTAIVDQGIKIPGVFVSQLFHSSGPELQDGIISMNGNVLCVTSLEGGITIAATPVIGLPKDTICHTIAYFTGGLVVCQEGRDLYWVQLDLRSPIALRNRATLIGTTEVVHE